MSNRREEEWDLVEDLGHDSCISPPTDISLPGPGLGTHLIGSVNSAQGLFHAASQIQYRATACHYSQTVAPFGMAPNLTAEEVAEARETERMARRAKSIAWTFAGVHKSDAHKKASLRPADEVPHAYAEEDRQVLRAKYLAWMFGGEHISNAHEDWDTMSPAEKDALRARLSDEQQELSDAQMGDILRGVRVKWCYVTTAEGTESVRVIEDSGAANNWISSGQVKKFGFSPKGGLAIAGVTLTGETFVSDSYVDVPWRGKGMYEGIDRFYVAPEKTPIDMLVGHDFTRKYAGAFMDQKPQAQLLTLQSRVNNDEQQQIDAGRKRMEEQASMLEKRRQAKLPPAPPTHAATGQSTTSLGQVTLVSKSIRQNSSK